MTHEAGEQIRLSEGIKRISHLLSNKGKQTFHREMIAVNETDREKAPRFSRHFSPQDEERKNGWGIGFARF